MNSIITYNIQKKTQQLRTIAPHWVGSSIVFLIGAYFLSQNTIPSHLKESYNITKWYILHPENAWSSVLYALPRTPTIMKIPLMSLAISSFSLWSNAQPYINFADVTNIYWVVITTSLYSLPYSKHKEKVIWVVHSSTTLFIVSSIYSGLYNNILTYYNANIVPFTGIINIICGIFLYSYYLDNVYFNISSLFIVCGYVCKLQTIYYQAYWGTSVFHIFTAIGIHILVHMNKPQIKNSSVINSGVINSSVINSGVINSDSLAMV